MKKKRIYLIIALGILLMISACGKKQDDARSLDQLYDELGIPVRTQEMALKFWTVSEIQCTQRNKRNLHLPCSQALSLRSRWRLMSKKDYIISLSCMALWHSINRQRPLSSIEAIHGEWAAQIRAISLKIWQRGHQYKVAKANLFEWTNDSYVRRLAVGTISW